MKTFEEFKADTNLFRKVAINLATRINEIASEDPEDLPFLYPWAIPLCTCLEEELVIFLLLKGKLDLLGQQIKNLNIEPSNRIVPRLPESEVYILYKEEL